jgi:hypothetical protein
VHLHNAPPVWPSCLCVFDHLPFVARLAQLYPLVRCTGAHPRSRRLAPVCYPYLPSRHTRSPPVPLSMSAVRSALAPHMLSSPVLASQPSYVPAFPCPCTAWLPALHPASICRPCMLVPTSLGHPGLALARLHMMFAGHLTHKLTFPLYLAACVKPSLSRTHNRLGPSCVTHHLPDSLAHILALVRACQLHAPSCVASSSSTCEHCTPCPLSPLANAPHSYVPVRSLVHCVAPLSCRAYFPVPMCRLAPMHSTLR